MADLAALQVSFTADLSQLSAAIDSVGAKGDGLAEVFNAAAQNMAEALNKPLDQVIAMQSAAEEAASGIADSNGIALASYDELGSGAGTALSSIGEGAASASTTLSDMTGAGESAGSSLIDILLEINQNIQNVSASVDGMSSAVTGTIEDLSAQFEELNVSASASSTAIAEAGASAESAGSGGFMNLFNQVGFGIMNFQNYLNIAKNVAMGLLGPATSAETVTTALTTLDGSAQAAGQEMQQLNAFAAKTPFKTLDIDTAAEQLQGFGVKANDVIPEITAIGDALGSVGRDTPAELDSVVQIFGKIHTEGKITAATMNELAIHGINGWQALADATGKSIPQLKDMVAKGLLPADDAIKDLTKGIEKNPLYAGGMSKAAGTFTGLLSTLQSNWDQVISAFGTPIIKGLEGSMSNLGTILAAPGFQNFAGAVGQGIVNVFQGIGSGVERVGGLLSSLHIGDVFGGFSKGLSDLSKNSAVTGFLGSLKDGFGQVSSIVGGTLSADFQTFKGVAQDLGKWWGSTMLPAIEQTLPSFERLGSVVATTVVPALARIWSVGQQVARDMLPPLVKGFEAVAPVVVKLGGFLADSLGKALQFLAPYAVQAAEALGSFAEGIISRVVPIVQELWNGIQAGIAFILPLWQAAWPTISGVLKGAWEIIQGVVEVAWNAVTGVIKVGLDLLSGNWGKAWDDIKAAFSGVWDGMKTIVSGIWQGIWSLIKGGINFVIGLINDLINGLDKIQINVGGFHAGVNIPDIPYLATGGFVAPGSVAVAGDAGPELVFGGSSGASVLSNSASKNALAGSGQPIYLIVDGQMIATAVLPRVAQGIIDATRSGHPVGGFA